MTNRVPITREAARSDAFPGARFSLWWWWICQRHLPTRHIRKAYDAPAVVLPAGRSRNGRAAKCAGSKERWFFSSPPHSTGLQHAIHPGCLLC
jgi:hypothetical protein